MAEASSTYLLTGRLSAAFRDQLIGKRAVFREIWTQHLLCLPDALSHGENTQCSVFQADNDIISNL